MANQLVELVILFRLDLVRWFTPKGNSLVDLFIIHQDRERNEIGVASNHVLDLRLIGELILVLLQMDLDLRTTRNIVGQRFNRVRTRSITCPRNSRRIFGLQSDWSRLLFQLP